MEKHTSGGIGAKAGVDVVRGRNKVTPNADVAIAQFVQQTTQMGVEGLRYEFAGIKGYVAENLTCTHFQSPANESRNRYNDVICLDATRVVLKLNVPPETDYIHANYVRMDGVDRTFIAAQGPLESTASDFWRMVFQENVEMIVMLCRCEENEKVKCFQYWPLEQGTYKNYGQMFVNNKKTEQEDRFITFTLEVLPDGCSNSNVVKLVQMIDWPDRGIPTSGMAVLRLLKHLPKNKNGGPTVIHCSAGIGRTGTVLCVETAIARLWKGQPISMKKIVCELRDRRASMVQTEGQYIFAHFAVLCYINAKMPKHRNSVMEFYEQFRQAHLN
ncbi:hypothetical protein M3Y98_00869400 [Aphelenchoides besseyi]|nr:hypothetical protein M3Y98_00869400 [Aphelenchoides besseyi]KAI6211267.1 hypothetical protein M3Y96_00415500 [Aphelenchoides besseyi]